MATAHQGVVAAGAEELRHVEDLVKLQLEHLGERIGHFSMVVYALGGLGLAAFAWAGNNLYQLNREVGVLTTQQASIQQDLNKTLDQLTSLNATLGKIVERKPAPRD